MARLGHVKVPSRFFLSPSMLIEVMGIKLYRGFAGLISAPRIPESSERVEVTRSVKCLF